MKASGILLPIFSLPSSYGIGCFSKEAYDFVDFLADSGQKYWQILPLGTIGAGNSPYLSFSSFAGSTLYIDLEQLVEEGLLTNEEIEEFKEENTGKVNYDNVHKSRRLLLRKAYTRFKPDTDFKKFVEDNKHWLDEYDAFMMEQKPECKEGYFKFGQYVFLKQWLKLKAYANDKGIEIIGDLPFYVALSGTAFKNHKELFKVTEDGEPSVVGGCPPDAFAKDGQVWSNPVYDWEYHKKTGYKWWMERLSHNFLLYDVLRLDHFRGFDEYFEIPAEDETAVNGEWAAGPGYDFFETMKQELGDKKVIAEDLGFLTDGVHKLLKDTGYPGMKILEFAFGAWDDSIYLPHKYSENCVVYTGTHDNDTVEGWYETLSQDDKNFLEHYLSHSTIERTGKVNLDLISLALESKGDMVIIPLQDYLGLGSEARINTPSTVGDNWEWRVKTEQLTDELKDTIYTLTKRYRGKFEEATENNQ
ncbi:MULTISPECIES: 4-alpha-glucanotransferase [Anaerostipes]|uniref:4-alpha-glucanotransferase n=1 Tax=Anaerostipes TaxID=207244 RepID=UPI00095117ED|nr:MULTISPECIES: 4-alpha-glucanotransferase [Anaerostipes]MCI5623902.1 4-alpha-glucanotransferase [Anaerostipes sp.]MDY2725358.1 4-alpha-glucanotransferase [Anaerostipes faecalis]OLR59882.1 4-alpha-glucanotransferase [Anaerostipes sp. 494a]